MTNPFAPKNYRDVVYSSVHARDLVDKIVNDTRFFPGGGKNGIVLFGSYGTGKTTLARILPGEIDARRGGMSTPCVFHETVGVSRNGPSLLGSIQSTISTSVSVFDQRCHYIILDEVDQIGAATMASLKSVMDQGNAIYIMTTNKLDQIDGGVISRSHLVDMDSASGKIWLPTARTLLQKMGLTKTISDETLIRLLDACRGDAREILSMLAQL